jgi:ribosomal-protein-alanine N-acetyltransferase
MGIATEAAQAVVDFGFRQLDMGRIIGLTLPENRASIRVLEKVGMKFEKTITIDGIQAAYYAMNAPR